MVSRILSRVPDHRNLHSFPTRRSSDLSGRIVAAPPATPSYVYVWPRPWGFGFAPFFPLRSEEHTSELQSHVNLVCRLLLEKKKFLNVIRPVYQCIAYRFVLRALLYIAK